MNNARVTYILPQDMTFQSQMVPYPLLQQNTLERAASDNIIKDQVHTTPASSSFKSSGDLNKSCAMHDILAFFFFGAQQLTAVILVHIMVDD